MKTISDPLKYWHLALESGSEDPALARMALDYLSMPGMCLNVHLLQFLMPASCYLSYIYRC